VLLPNPAELARRLDATGDYRQSGWAGSNHLSGMGISEPRPIYYCLGIPCSQHGVPRWSLAGGRSITVVGKWTPPHQDGKKHYGLKNDRENHSMPVLPALGGTGDGQCATRHPTMAYAPLTRHKTRWTTTAAFERLLDGPLEAREVRRLQEQTPASVAGESRRARGRLAVVPPGASGPRSGRRSGVATARA